MLMPMMPSLQGGPLVGLEMLSKRQFFSKVTFFNNDIDTETNGLDLVATYGLDWAGGETVFSASVN